GDDDAVGREQLPVPPVGAEQAFVQRPLVAQQPLVDDQVVDRVRVGRVLAVGAPVGGPPGVGELVGVDAGGQGRDQVVGGRPPGVGRDQPQGGPHDDVAGFGPGPDAVVVVAPE